MADTFTVERTQRINAAPADVFAHIVDFHRWAAWSPWEGLDPSMDKTYTGDPGTVGSTYAWKGNRKVGQGNMRLVAVDVPNRVDIDLEFLKPFKARNDTVLSIAEVDGASEVTWTMTGEKTLMTKIMGIFKSMDAMVGPDFEQGLRSLKEVAES